MFRIGQASDIHRLVSGRDFILGGVTIPHETGLLGHSDADMLVHVVIDALLGALALGNIGTYFPDTDPAYAGANSLDLLDRVMVDVSAAGYVVVNVDTTVICQAPKLNPHTAAMRANLARHLQVDVSQVSVKPTTAETMGFVGRGEGVMTQAVVLVQRAA